MKRRSQRPLRSDRDELGYLATEDNAVRLPASKLGEHRWFVPPPVSAASERLESCRECGVVRGPKNEAKPCPGKTPGTWEDILR